MTFKGVDSQDILPEGQDYKVIRGVTVRKGTIAAAMANMDLLESGSEEEAEAARAKLRELAPALVVLGVHKHFQCRNPELEQLLARTAQELA